MKPIRVAFLGLYFEAWDALDEVYRLMLKDERFEPVVISLPRKLTGQLRYADEEKAHDFFQKKGIEHIRFNVGGDGSDNQEGLEALKKLAPDYVFVNYPWQRNYQPAIRFDNLARFTRLAYIPYFSLVMVEEPEDEPGGGQGTSPVATHLYKQRLHQLASLVFTQDSFVKKAYAETERGNDHVLFLGSPKIDALTKEAELGSGSWPIARGLSGDLASVANSSKERPFRLVWAPHHSYSPHWLNFGVFSKIKDQMLKLAQEDKEIEIVLRPHPFLWGTLVDRKVLTEQELKSWREAWDALSNTYVDEDGSYAELFLATDALMTDGISFLGEYPLVTQKPAIFFENPGHWKFSPVGEIAANSSIRIASFEDFLATLQEIKTKGLPDRSSEIKALQEVSSPYPGESAKRIVETVFQHFNSPSGKALIDPDSISETAWEFVPGREPFED